MEKIKSFALLLITVIFLASVPLKAQWLHTCSFDEEGDETEFIGGNHKPERTDVYSGTGSASYFPVLMVFVQFASGEPHSSDANWPAGSAPADLNNYIAGTKATNYGSNWWDAYSEANDRLSDYWMEVSRGHFHIIGQAYSITLPLSASSYQSTYGSDATEKINDDIYAELEQVVSNWNFYDQWSKVNGNFVYDDDGYIDMIYIVHRSWANVGGMPAGGIALLGDSYAQGTEYTIPNTSLKIRGDHGDLGSGLRMTPGHGGGTPYAPMDLKGTVSFSGHEHGHYLWGGSHAAYGKMMGFGAEFGLDEYLSPWESIKLGYMEAEVVDFSSETGYSIGDISSRHSSNQGEVLQVPISGTDEFFLIANRQKVSSYDKIMWGDTCHDNPYFNLGSQDAYAKGVYIYHTPSGYTWPPAMDQECADGLWNWQYVDDQAPDWDPTNNWLPYFEKTTVVRNSNDAGATGLTARDGKSIFSNSHYKWFSVGKKQASQYGTGTDRFFANEEEPWTSREWKGDRWDAWNVGYNEVFSPYSSPSTVEWDDDATGIFIYLENQSSSTAEFEIYKVGEGGWDESEILAATPPSRPMLFRDIELYNCTSNYASPRIIWDNNMEPDMLRGSGFTQYKRYKIYKAVSDPSAVPLVYTHVATYDDYTPNDTANFIDNHPTNGVSIYCGSGSGYNDYHYRYKITAVDNTDWESVKSDFVSIDGEGENPDNPLFSSNEAPARFSLLQNYPNPFNPSTDIKFVLPQNTYVTIKIYNAIGEEVALLVNNEWKTTGRYSVKFDGSNLASGIYFYTINAGSFRDTKKMVLIK